MVVLDSIDMSPLATGVGLLDPLDANTYAQAATRLKMIPKRFINVHQWLGPICTKDLKAQLVRYFYSLFSLLFYFVLF